MAVQNPSDRYTMDEIIDRLKELCNEDHPNPIEFERLVNFLTDKLNAKMGRTRIAG